MTYLSIPIALRMSLRVFVKKRRPPKPAFFVLYVDGKVFMITNTFVAVAFFIKASIWLLS